MLNLYFYSKLYKRSSLYKLAVNSLVEIIVRCATIYLLLYTLTGKGTGNVFSDVITSLYSSKGIFESTCGINPVYIFISQSVAILQAVTSFVLIVFSFAKYISSDDKEDNKNNN